jgi:hypothetical protein
VPPVRTTAVRTRTHAVVFADLAGRCNRDDFLAVMMRAASHFAP